MQRLAVRSATVFLALAALASSGVAQRMIACDSSRVLSEIDITTGAKTAIGTISVNAGTTAGLAYDRASQTMYLTSTGNDSLYTLDITTGTATLVGAYGDSAIVMHGLEWDSSTGTLYGESSHNGGLYSISTVTGVATLIGTSGLTGFTNLGFDSANNVMYATNGGTDSLYTMNLGSGAATLVGALNGPTNPNGVAFNSDDGTMYLVDNSTDTLYSINLATGAATVIGSTGTGNLLGLAYIPREPAMPFTITSTCTPNAVYEVTSYPTSSTSAVGFANFRCTGAAGQDQLYQSTWWYRIDNDAREYVFNNGATSGLQPEVIAPKGDRATLNWLNCDGRGFDANLAVQVYTTGPSSGVASECMTVTNNTAAAVTFNVFHYVDYDVCGSAGDSTAFVGTPNQLEVTDSVCAVKTYHLACGYSNYQTTAFATVRGLLANAVVDDLNNSGTPFGPGDMTNAYQWQNVVVGPGQSASFYVGLGCDRQIPCCDVSTIENYCVAKAGTNGLPAWGSNRMYIAGQAELKVEDGFPGSAPIVFLGVPPNGCVPVPPYGSLAINPILTNFFMPPFAANGVSSFCLPIPSDANLCGLTLNMQAFFVDPGAAANIAHTDGCSFTIGSL